MKEILWLIVLTLFCGWIIDRQDYAYSSINSIKKECFVTFCICIILCVFCGLRTWYNDTVTYIQIYTQTTSLAEFWQTDAASISRGLGFGFLNCILKELGFSVQDYLMFYSFCSIIPCVYFIRKYSVSCTMSFFLMFATGYYIFNFAAIKQCVATGICLWAIGFALDQKWVKYILLIGLAVLFHPYAFVYLCVPFMIFRPGKIHTYIYILIFVLVGIFLQNLLVVVFNVTDMIGSEYVTGTFSEEGVSIFRVLVAFVPIFIALLGKFEMFKNSSKEEWIIFNMALLNALIMFIGLFGTANYFARLANYFLPAQIVTIPWLIKKMDPNSKRMMILLCLIGYSLYFYYENVILRPFDICHSGISIFDYLISYF